MNSSSSRRGTPSAFGPYLPNATISGRAPLSFNYEDSRARSAASRVGRPHPR